MGELRRRRRRKLLRVRTAKRARRLILPRPAQPRPAQRRSAQQWEISSEISRYSASTALLSIWLTRRAKLW